MISSTFFFLFSQLGVGMLLTLLFISPRSIGNSFFKFASLTAAILLGVTLGFNFMFPSPVRENQVPVILLLVSAILTTIYNRVVDVDKFNAAFVLLVGATATGLVSVATDSLAFTRLMALGGWENWMLLVNHLAATALLGTGPVHRGVERVDDPAGDVLLAADHLWSGSPHHPRCDDLEHRSNPAHASRHRPALPGGCCVIVRGILFEVPVVCREYSAVTTRTLLRRGACRYLWRSDLFCSRSCPCTACRSASSCRR